MKTIWNWIQLGIATVGGFIGWLLGGLDPPAIRGMCLHGNKSRLDVF